MGSKLYICVALFLSMVLLLSSPEVADARQLIPASNNQVSAGGLSHVSTKEAAKLYGEDPVGYGPAPCPRYRC